jgi:hypothetical protein
MDPMFVSTLEFKLFQENQYSTEMPIAHWKTPRVIDDTQMSQTLY